MFGGFLLGNHAQTGCLTDDQSVRLHSCERNTNCQVFKSPQTVFIRPILSRDEEGHELAEMGVGGGGGDLVRKHELEPFDNGAIANLIDLCNTAIADPQKRDQILTLLSIDKMSNNLSLGSGVLNVSTEDIGLEEFARKLAAFVGHHQFQPQDKLSSPISPDMKILAPTNSQASSLVSKVTQSKEVI